MSEVWYRKLLVAALVLGVGGGVIALVYSGVTNFGIGRFYGEPTAEVWSGQWWWIPLVSGGAVLVVALRGLWKVPEKVPGAIAFAKRGWVDPLSAISLVLISAISLFVGASLGPSFGIVVGGGGMGAWLVSRSSTTDTEAQHEYSLTGMGGGLGAVFSAPLFASVLASELSTTPKSKYVAAFIPEFTAATIGYVIFFGVTGEVMLDAFEIPGYEYETVHLLYGLLLGVLAVFTLLVQSIIGNAVRRLAALAENAYVRAAAGGALVGLIAFALPLTATGGSKQLAYATQNTASLGIGLLLAVLVGKMMAITLSQEAGFLGGTVFPILFIGGAAGIVVHGLLPDIPIALAVAAMIAAVPGAIIGAPVSFILIAVGGVGLGVTAVAPIGIAVITAHLTVGAIKVFAETRESM
ncbi:MAG: chloride channel protein [Acidimicrobiia bacterium]|nr:chloride channel protein [Acidimicrobiia bacterium]